MDYINIDTDYLNATECETVVKILKDHDIESFENAFVRFWGKDEIQIDGELSFNEMQALVEAMRKINA